MDEEAPKISFQPKLTGREKEFEWLVERWAEVRTNRGSTIMISGEAGIGKTRLVTELVELAHDAKVIKGWCLTDALEPLMPFKRAFMNADMYHLIAEKAPPKVISAYLINKDGILIAKTERTETDLDPDIFASMLTAVGNFVGDSLSMMGESGESKLSAIGYGHYQILIQTVNNLSIAAVIEGGNSEFLIDDLRKTLSSFGDKLQTWNGDTSIVKELEPHISWFVESGKYEGEYLVDDPKLKQENLFDNVLLGLQRLSSKQPIILFLDDLQWADPTSLKLLHYLARNTKENRVMIICNYRPEDIDVADPFGKVNQLRTTMQNMSREDLFDEIKLNRLDESSVKDLINEILEDNELLEGFIEKLTEESEGNPFFLLEIIRILVEEDVLVEESNTWKTKKTVHEIRITSKMYDIIVRRLDRLLAEQRELLECASVVGEEFESSVVGEVTEMNRVILLKHLNNIEKRHKLIRLINKRYRFDHNKIREVLYNSINEELREEFHKLIGKSYEKIYADNIDKIIGKLAKHYYSGKYPDACKYLLKAGDKLKSDYSNEEAVDFYKKAVQCSTNDSEKKMGLYGLGEINSTLGDYEESLKSYKDILEMHTTDSERIRAYIKISEIHRDIGDFDSAVEYCDKGLSSINDPSSEFCELLNIKGWALMREKGYEEASSLFNEERKSAEEIQDDWELAQAFHNLGTISWFKGDYRKAIIELENALELRRSIGDVKGESDTLNNLGTVYYDDGDLDRSMYYHSKSLEIEEKIGNKHGIAMSLNNIGVIFKNKGRLKDALNYYNKSLNFRERIGDKQGIASTLYNIGNLYLHIGDLNNAYNHHVRSQFEAEKIKDKQGIVMSLEKIGEIKRLEGDLDDALEYYKRSVEISKEIGFEPYIVYGLCGMANIYLTKGDDELALKISTESLDLSKKFDTGMEEFLSRLTLGKVLTKMGHIQNARDNFLVSEKIVNETGSKGDRALFHYEYAHMWLENGDIDKAQEHLVIARSQFEEMGMRFWVNRTKDAVARLRIHRSE